MTGVKITLTLYAPERNEWWVSVTIGKHHFRSIRFDEEQAKKAYKETKDKLSEIETSIEGRMK